MIEVTLDDRKIKVDTELTIEKYQVIQRNPERYESPSEILALYLGITSDELKDLPVEKIRFVESVLSNHIMQPYNDEVVFTFQHKGITYGLENDWNNIKWGQWVDLEVLSQPDRINENIHILMALLYRPIIVEEGLKYKLEPYKSKLVMERAEVFKELPVRYWFGGATFFLTISKLYITDIKSSLTAVNRILNLLKPVTKRLPKWAQPKRLHAFISNFLTSYVMKT
jgi:hypothetical protein